MKGSGYQPQRGNICTISFVGKLDDGTVVESKSNIDIQIGDVEVIKKKIMRKVLDVYNDELSVYRLFRVWIWQSH